MLTTNLYKGTEVSTGISYLAGVFSCDIALMNAVVDEYNTTNGTDYPLWDTVSDNFERFMQFLLIYSNIQNLSLGNDTFNLKIGNITASNSVYGTRGSLNSRSISINFPFSNQSQVWGDTDNLG
jgi:hypothetical protein